MEAYYVILFLVLGLTCAYLELNKKKGGPSHLLHWWPVARLLTALSELEQNKKYTCIHVHMYVWTYVYIYI